MLAGMPAPAAGPGQLAQQVVSGEAGQKQRALEQFGLSKQYFAARVHGVDPDKSREFYQNLVGAS
ncbi:hypothetical protein D3C86_2252010 [compost metagenome]